MAFQPLNADGVELNRTAKQLTPIFVQNAECKERAAGVGWWKQEACRATRPRMQVAGESAERMRARAKQWAKERGDSDAKAWRRVEQ